MKLPVKPQLFRIFAGRLRVFRPPEKEICKLTEQKATPSPARTFGIFGGNLPTNITAFFVFVFPS